MGPRKYQHMALWMRQGGSRQGCIRELIPTLSRLEVAPCLCPRSRTIAKSLDGGIAELKGHLA